LVFAATIIVNAFNYVFHLVISRRLGVVDYGTLYALFAGMAFFGAPANILTMIVVRYAAEFRVLGDGAHLRALSTWAFKRTAVLAAVVVFLGMVFARPIAQSLRIDDARSVVLASAILAASVVLPSVMGILQGAEDFNRFAVSTVLEGFLKAALGIGLVCMGFGVNGALTGFALSSVIAFVYTLFVVRKRFARSSEPLHLNARRLAKTSAGIVAATAALNVLGFSDVLLVKHFFSPRDAGLYSVVSLAGKVLYFLVGFIPAVVLPKVTARVSRGESAAVVLIQAGLCIVGICGSALCFVFLAPGLVVRVMSGDAFSAAAPLVFPYACAMTLLALSGAAVAYKVGVHRFDFVPFLWIVALGEVAALAFLHGSLAQVVRVLLVGHACAAAGVGATFVRRGAQESGELQHPKSSSLVA
jgi:O-antigen/teichoic acid export membrane protein